jgi:superfamily II DNA or RNA helicase
MNLWSIMSPHAEMIFAPGTGVYAVFMAEISSIAGIKEKNGVFKVPLNVISTIQNLVLKYGVQVVHVAWVKAPRPPKEWPAIERVLRESGEVKNAAFDLLAPYQKRAISFTWHRDGTHLWMPTGSGKTITSLLSALALKGSVLMVTRSAARIQMAREIQKFLNIEPYVIRAESTLPAEIRRQGTPTQRLEAYVQGAKHRPFVVAGWDSLARNLSMLSAYRPQVLLLDECHLGKSKKRFDVVHLATLPEDPEEAALQVALEEAQAREVNGFIKEVENKSRKLFIPITNMASSAAELSRIARRRISTTASPIADRIRDLWSQLDMVEPNSWGNASSWTARYADAKKGAYGGSIDTRGASHLEELAERLKSSAFILKHADTHADLPKKRRQSIYISPEDQNKELSGFAEEIKRANKMGSAALLEVRLAIAASKKRDAVLDLIKDHIGSQQKTVVFTARRKDCEALGESVRGLLPSGAAWAAHGDQSMDRRQAVVDEFMAHPGPCCLVATGHAFGESLNLDTADAALFVMLPYSPGQLRQWEGRFSRKSSKKPVVLYYLIAEGTADERVASILIDKLPPIGQIAEDAEIDDTLKALGGTEDSSPEDFAASILALLDR